MKSKVIGFSRDEDGDWVALLECRHTRHVRNNPPFSYRPWVESREGREEFIDSEFRCVKCERGEPLDF